MTTVIIVSCLVGLIALRWLRVMALRRMGRKPITVKQAVKSWQHAKLAAAIQKVMTEDEIEWLWPSGMTVRSQPANLICPAGQPLSINRDDLPEHSGGGVCEHRGVAEE